MKVKQLIIDAVRHIAREDIALELDNELYAPVGTEGVRIRRLLLFCFNAVVNELARAYFPVKKVDVMTPVNGQISFTSLSQIPVRILSVKRGERQVEWHICPGYLQTEDETVEVEYEFCPDKVDYMQEFFYPDPCVSENLIMCGMIAEYFLICGEFDSSTAWENKYRAEIDRLMSLKTVKGRIPPRRWV